MNLDLRNGKVGVADGRGRFSACPWDSGVRWVPRLAEGFDVFDDGVYFGVGDVQDGH